MNKLLILFVSVVFIGLIVFGIAYKDKIFNKEQPKEEQPKILLNEFVLNVRDYETKELVDVDMIAGYFKGKEFIETSRGKLSKDNLFSIYFPHNETLEIYAWNDEDYPLQHTAKGGSLEPSTIPITLDVNMYKTAEISVSHSGILEKGDNFLDINIDSKGVFSRPVLCTSRSLGIINIEDSNKVTCEQGWIDYYNREIDSECAKKGYVMSYGKLFKSIGIIFVICILISLIVFFLLPKESESRIKFSIAIGIGVALFLIGIIFLAIPDSKSACPYEYSYFNEGQYGCFEQQKETNLETCSKLGDNNRTCFKTRIPVPKRLEGKVDYCTTLKVHELYNEEYNFSLSYKGGNIKCGDYIDLYLIDYDKIPAESLVWFNYVAERDGKDILTKDYKYRIQNECKE